jgi:hypothetical protein
VEIDVFVLDGTPKPLGEDIISGASPAIHANLDLVGQQAIDILQAGKVTALIAVPNMGYGLQQSFIHRLEHEIEFERLLNYQPTMNLENQSKAATRYSQPAFKGM